MQSTETAELSIDHGARLLIYAAAPDRRMLRQGFYAAEADGLAAHPTVARVDMTNRLSDVASGRYDGLVTFFYSHSAASTAIARARGKPAVATGGGEQLFRALAGSALRHAVRMTAFQLTAASATRILATSTSDLERMTRAAPFRRGKIKLSHHGAVAAEFPVPVGSGERPPGSLVTIAGLDTPLNVWRKGVLDAVALLARVRAEQSEATLTIIGRTTCRDMVEAHARALGVENAVLFTGYVTQEQKIAALRASRYYVQLSSYEGFGIGALEALSQGCRVIHSGQGGLVDTIGHFGVLLRPGEIDRFSLRSVPRWEAGSQAALDVHLAGFRPAVRADAIVRALFDERAGDPTFARSA